MYSTSQKFTDRQSNNQTPEQAQNNVKKPSPRTMVSKKSRPVLQVYNDPKSSQKSEDFRTKSVKKMQPHPYVRRITVNTFNCRYEIDALQYVIGKQGFKEIAFSEGTGNILWYGNALRDQDLEVIKKNSDAVFNRFPLMDHFAKKNILSVILSRLQRFFPEDFAFMPDYYLLPEEIDDLQLSMKDNPECTFIAKPSKGKAGKGIKIIKNFSELPKAAQEHEYLVQRYIEDPLLANGKKFDVRLYLVVCGVDPM